MILKCALAIIADRGSSITRPALASLREEEAKFLADHVTWLRRRATAGRSRGRFRASSTLDKEFNLALAADDAAFLEIANRLVDDLAATIRVSSSSCVLALITSTDADGAGAVTLLKLDADVEAASFDTEADGRVHLNVLADLLPKPGDIQKALSWPDRRADSDLIVHDAVTADTALYFQNAYRIDAAPTDVSTENALVAEVSKLAPERVPAAVQAIEMGGDAETVVARLRNAVPEFATAAPELGANGAMAGHLRSGFVSRQKVALSADGIRLLISVTRIGDIHTVRRGDRFVTTIVTDTPLTKPED
ncbi:MAG TPA: hypothetical protein VGC04_02730 [Cellulomonas sp.]